MTTFGSPTGVLYCLGRINIVTPGTAVALSQNVPITVAMGANSPNMRANEITFKAPGGAAATGATGQNIGNVGNIYVCYKGGGRATQNSIICDLAPGQGYVLSSSAGHSPYDLSQIVVDGDNANDGCRVSAIIV